MENLQLKNTYPGMEYSTKNANLVILLNDNEICVKAHKQKVISQNEMVVSLWCLKKIN